MDENKNVNVEETNAEESKENKTEQNQNTGTENKQKEINVEETKNQAVGELLKALGVESKEDLSSIVNQHKQDEEAKKTDLEKATDSNKTLTKRLVEEKERADIAEAKLAAITLGAKPDLVDDLVIVAKSKVTEDKKILDVIEEIKKSNSGSVYFVSEEEKEEKKQKKGVVTRMTSKTQENKQEQERETKGNGLAERLLGNRQKQKNHYFTN